jgi:UDP-N-acetylglucosamine 4,6-dehydratase
MAPDCVIEDIGIRPGEKVHEVLLSEDEARHSVELDDRFVINPMHQWWKDQPEQKGRPLAEGFRYTSDNNSEWLSMDELLAMANDGHTAELTVD